MLNAATSPKEVGDAFWMIHYVCDRIGPDPETVSGWLDRVLARFADHRELSAKVRKAEMGDDSARTYFCEV
jgi:hypothetical protein